MSGTLKPLFTWRAAICESDLGPTARHVAITLSIYMSERGESAHPGPARLASDTGLHITTVKDKLAELEEKGWIRCVERGGRKGERRRANEYVATLPDIPLFDAPGVVGDPSPSTTRRRDRDYPSSSPRLPVVVDDPISSKNSPVNSRRGAEAPTPTPRGQRIPIPYVVQPADIAWAEQEHPGVDWDGETKKFVDHWRAKSGRDATKLDWPATWRNWIRRASEGFR